MSTFIHTIFTKKTYKWDIKVWACCDAITGYIYAFEVYTGADKSAPKSIHGQGYDVVMSLMSPLLGKGYAVYTDNFYSSPQLFQDLSDSKTSASGTVRRNRKHFPENLDVTSKMNRGDCKFLHCNSLTICRWFDNRDVTIEVCFVCQHVSVLLPQLLGDEFANNRKMYHVLTLWWITTNTWVV